MSSTVEFWVAVIDTPSWHEYEVSGSSKSEIHVVTRVHDRLGPQ